MIFKKDFENKLDKKFLESVKLGLNWIARGQDNCSSGGVPAYYIPIFGWSGPYPETTGYIIPTLLAYSKFVEGDELKFRAEKMGDWLLSIQMINGAFPGGIYKKNYSNSESIFNSGQILFGLIALWKETKEDKWKNAGLNCANWLKEQQNEDGSWTKYEYRNVQHIYNTRVAWAMVLAGITWGDEELIFHGRKNIENSLNYQDERGWFEKASFDENGVPVLHTFAYTVQGILEVGILLGRQDFISAALLSAESVAKSQRKDGSLPGLIHGDFREVGFSCLTGIAQQVIIWGRLSSINNDYRYLINHSNMALSYVRDLQVKKAGHQNQGGFAGSKPLWANYMRFRYPNWAVKFYLDAVLANEDLILDCAWG